MVGSKEIGRNRRKLVVVSVSQLLSCAHRISLVAPSNYLELLVTDNAAVNGTSQITEPALEVYPFKAEALHTCPSSIYTPIHYLTHVTVDTASSEDPSELSFRQGEVLDILTKSDLWWEARNSRGRKGSS